MDRSARLIPPLTLMALIWFLSAQPDLGTGLGGWDLLLRKLGHMGIFGALALAWWWALGDLRPAVGIALAWAVTDEVHQSFVVGRDGTVVDVAIDAAGIAVAAALARVRRRGRAAGAP